MAKTRAQRKAERRKRQAQQARQAEQSRTSDSQAQHRTQTPESADVAEAELAEHGADLDALRGAPQPEAPERQVDRRGPEAPAPSRADVGRPEPAEDKISRRERRKAEREEARRVKESQERRRPREEPVERQRGRVMAFFISCWAELKRVQWPDRPTLIQASAVTLIFITVAAAFLGVLDAIFNELVQLIL
jgi:preprotein translocase SecE subunit